ncbi:MAG: hypothetical protein JWP44_4591 [Mucilaginibacter sp.]|nr:hypothetical protein [Mucilaginibacter sp.]
MPRRVPHPKPVLLGTLLVAAAGLVLDPASAQQALAPSPAGTTSKIDDSAGFTMKASARLVLVDVTVQDSRGLPVHGLKPGDLRLEEGRQPQALKSFEEHPAANAGGAAAPGCLRCRQAPSPISPLSPRTAHLTSCFWIR